ncbi:benzoyl-CoA reductase [Candidatus Micrarchaeota archaeon]|nr:MAG: benzoyl-CoA reductase [Candidatus Micrarchaeota archaeon]
MFDKFREWYENRHEYAKDWKEKTGGKVVGYICTYIPEEILYAANVLPVRILGGHEPESIGLAEPYLFGMYCPFCRDCLAQGLQGKYAYLDGIVIGQSCIHIRQTFFSWRQRIPHEFDHYIPMPMNVVTPRASIPFLRKELEIFKSALERWLEKEITDDDLRRGIEIVNKNRRLMKKVYNLRREPNPKLTGLEAMYMVVSSQLTDKNEHSDAIEEMFNNGLATRDLGRESSIRLMTVGSENDDVEFTKMVEETLGATIVIEDHCTGSRYFWEEVKLDEKDPLTAIAERYVTRTPCPQRDWEPERIRFRRILDLIEEFGVQGVLLIQQKFCDPHELDIPALRDLLNEKGIKNYFLEFDVTVPVGQFRIRVEAFLETFASDELFAEDIV